MKRWIPVALAVFALGFAGCDDDDEGPSEPPSDDIQGRVLDTAGQPVSGVPIVVSGKAAAITANDGSFTVEDVPSTYDVSVIFNTQNAALIYRGLTRRDPVLSYITVASSPKSAEIAGTVPAVPGRRTRVFFVSGEWSAATTANANTGDYSLAPEWYGSAAAITGTIYVLRWTQGLDGLPDLYDGYAERDLTISDGGTFPVSFAAGDLTDPSELTIKGDVVVPTGYFLQQKSFGLDFGIPRIVIDTDGAAATSFNFNVPEIPEPSFFVSARAAMPTVTTNRTTSITRTGLAAGATGIDVVLEEAPRPSLPVHSATGVTTSTSFVWSAGGGTGVNIYIANPAVSSNPTYMAILAENSTQIPDLSAIGMGLPAGAQYDWGVLRQLGVSSVNDAASAAFNPILGVREGDSGRLTSEFFAFTTEP